VTDAIITAFITGGVTLIVCLLNNHFQAKAAEKKHDETIALIDYKLEELTKRVDKHNNVIERTYKLEESTALIEEKIKVANNRIKDLEERPHD
jgi:peptidoglycan hydrolase CwlO-like protein